MPKTTLGETYRTLWRVRIPHVNFSPKDPWEKGNISKCKWVHVAGVAEEETPNKSVISYFKKLKRDGCLGAAQLKLVEDHAMWNVAAAAGGDSGNSHDEENENCSEDGELENSSDSEVVHGGLHR